MASDPTTGGGIDSDQSRRIGILEEKVADVEKSIGGIRGTWRGLRRSKSFRNGFFAGMLLWMVIGALLCYWWKGSSWDFTRNLGAATVVTKQPETPIHNVPTDLEKAIQKGLEGKGGK